MHLSLISIGKPEVGLALCEHLGVKDGMDWIYADPNNRLYDALMTNRGWNTMIRPATALRFKDRIFDSVVGRKGGGGGSMDQVSVESPCPVWAMTTPYQTHLGCDVNNTTLPPMSFPFFSYEFHLTDDSCVP